MPLTIPVEPTVARAVLLLLHIPPVLISVNGVVTPVHTVGVPPIANGVWLTVIVTLAKQVVGKV